MSVGVSEDGVEALSLEWFKDLGYSVLNGPNIGPDGANTERSSYGETILQGRMMDSLTRINPDLSSGAIEEAMRRIEDIQTPSLIEENRRLHRLISEGVDVEVILPDGSRGTRKCHLIDFDTPDNNDFAAVNQLTVIEGGHNRRPDVVVYVNGMPLGVIELKRPGDEDATLGAAYNQLQTYKAQIPSLFRQNVMLVTSDGLKARVGSLTAGEDRFMPWRTMNGIDVSPPGWPELETVVKGVFDKELFLDYLNGFIVFDDDGSKVIKKIAGYHQFHAVRKALAKTIEATRSEGDRKAGVVWHTQGSGKSLLMAFYTGQLVRHPALENPTVVVITDRNDLDDQLYGTFSSCADLIRQTPVQAKDRDDLKEKLSVTSGGVIFTTIQKFQPEDGEEAYPVLTDRTNVVVMADEAHRSQYGMTGRMNDEGVRKYGYAKYMRDALPNASFIGFTGTPIETSDVNTRATFGDYVDVYDISQAVEDGATVPIFYESRLARIELDEEVADEIDDFVEEVTEDEDLETREKIKGKWARVEALVGAENRLKLIAKDMVEHFEARQVAMDGKAMIVCMSRRICVELYNEIIALRPDWHSDDPNAGAVKIVMTGSASDPEDWQKHIGNKTYRDNLAKRARKVDDPLKLVIVRDMWLTGFDAPSMHTLYVDKPMQGHGLMQAIARVNRVFGDKPGGLVVDYIGIAQNLKKALHQYSEGDREKTGIDEEEAVAVLKECVEVLRGMFHDFDYSKGVRGEPKDRLYALAGALNHVLEMQERDMAREQSAEAKKKARNRFSDAVVRLSKAFALASASDYALEVRDEVGFFQTVRSALVKDQGLSRGTAKDPNIALQQVVSRAVISTEIVDILKATGIKSQDLSVLSDDFLAEIQNMERKNLALEALKRLLNGEIRNQSRRNIVQARAFSERLQEAMNRYHANAITAVEMIEELIRIAKEVRAAKARGEEQGLSEDEIAFYDALAANESAKDMMGDQKLLVVAHELLERVKRSVSVDWHKSENARARIRLMVKKILKKYGYPPDLQDEAVKTVIAQAEQLSALWTK
ncbi:DEAD/DEAH box helicase [Kordiimonas sediminis]|uniref:Type I restriction enzyme endonuclease subunit n=1 Tax=Kordiimonas sediminis TaxID=1735581 RepID=A0A919E4T7_9PROT|nr:type I restriction endonuclease subunit R [Kordiimonas sediminis]GHF13895.1 DEAD/DEAH box helicase [Kordiimonas sediminis]